MCVGHWHAQTVPAEHDAEDEESPRNSDAVQTPHSLPPLLKNTLDWVSRVRHTGTIPYRYKVYGIGSTSNGFIGGARALIELRKVLATSVRGIVVPDKIEVSRAQMAFNESGEFIDEAPAALLRALTRRLVDLAQRLAD